MAKNFNSTKFKYFVLVSDVAAKGGTVSFKSYTDESGVFGNAGAPVEYVVSKDDKGRDKGKWFTLSQASRSFVTRDGEKDVNGKSQYDFLKNSPNCEGSPNNNGKAILFREMNDNADAEVALEALDRKIDAQASAKSIDEVTMLEIAAHIGLFGEPDKKMRWRILEYAGKQPEDYFEVLNSGDRPVRAIVRKAISEGIFTKKGSLIFWEATVIGNDEDAAVAALLADKAMLEPLQERVALNTKVKVSTKKK